MIIIICAVVEADRRARAEPLSAGEGPMCARGRAASRWQSPAGRPHGAQRRIRAPNLVCSAAAAAAVARGINARRGTQDESAGVRVVVILPPARTIKIILINHAYTPRRVFERARMNIVIRKKFICLMWDIVYSSALVRRGIFRAARAVRICGIGGINTSTRSRTVRRAPFDGVVCTPIAPRGTRTSLVIHFSTV